MLEKFKAYVDKWQMLKSEDCVIVGVSGGADSICLVLLLLELKKTIGFQMIAVHVNHGLRGKDADADEAYVKAFCEKHGILFESYFVDVELIAKNRKQSTEEAGREARRECFEKALQAYHGTKIALAHHKDDSAETLMLNLARGTGLRGLGGIVPVKGQIIRPLLCVRRQEIENYLQKQNIDFCVDQTNADDMYTRNRIRNHVIPYLEQHINSKSVEHMNETMEQLRLVQQFLDEQTDSAWQSCVSESAMGYLVSQEKYDILSEVLKPLVLKQALIKVSGREKDIESVHIAQIRELFKKQSGRKLDLPYGMEAKRVYEGVFIGLKNNALQQQAGLSQRNIQYRVFDISEVQGKTFEKNNTEWFDYDIIEHNLSFRTRQEGDYITIHPDGRTQKIKSYFINEKIPKEERDRVLLVVDGSHVMWIVGYRTNIAYRVGPNTKRVLEISINEGER